MNGLNAPAWIFVAPPVNVGLNGRLAPGHALSFGPEVMLNVEEEGRSAAVRRFPAHGANDGGGVGAAVRGGRERARVRRRRNAVRRLRTRAAGCSGTS